MNALDRQAAEIIADWLHQQDPRFEWEARPAGDDAKEPVVWHDEDHR